MLNIQLSDDLTRIAHSLAAQKNVSVDKVVEEALIALQNQIDEVEENDSSIEPFDPEFDAAYHLAKSHIARYHGSLLGRILEERAKPNPDNKLLAILEANQKKHILAGRDLLSKTTEELDDLVKEYSALISAVVTL